jgi:A/G-specific adenine glycosylase
MRQDNVLPRDERLYEEIAGRLQSWYAARGRKYPWREGSDPYVILITEFLLQRTKAEVVASAFYEFFSRYKTIQELASAEPKDLSAFFSKLGLLYRGERILETARKIVEGHGGEIPCDMEQLLRMKGVGMYIASAVLNFGCNVPTPVVDKNVMRVMNRLFDVTNEEACRGLISELYRHGDSRLIAYALIDLGAVVCVEPPFCKECPLDDVCAKYPLRKERWRMYRKVLRNGKVILQEQPVS